MAGGYARRQHPNAVYVGDVVEYEIPMPHAPCGKVTFRALVIGVGDRLTLRGSPGGTRHISYPALRRLLERDLADVSGGDQR